MSPNHPFDVSPRPVVAQALAQVLFQGRSLTSVLNEKCQSLNASQAGFTQAVCYGVLRWYPRLQAFLKILLRKPLKPKDGDIHCLLLSGLYELSDAHAPDYAVVAECVNTAKALNKPWAAGLVNAVLRSYQRQQSLLQAEVDAVPSQRLAHPDWLLQQLQEDWPQDYMAIAEANNQQAPMTLRCNGTRIRVADFQQRLLEHGIDFEVHPYVETALLLKQAMDVRAIPGYAQGWFSVQDAAAQLTPRLLELQPGQRVLDACAAPGGKSSHIIEASQQSVALTVLELETSRMQRLLENLQRLGLQAEAVVADLLDLDAWWDGKLWQRILLDAPCSATGVIRRHPDIKVLRRPEDIRALAKKQAEMLDRLWPIIAPGGMLLYATCSTLKQENTDQIAAFLARHVDAEEKPITASWGLPCTHGRQILPGMAAMDGFYFARLIKRGRQSP